MKLLRPRWRKALRDILSNKSRAVLVVLSIAVGIFTIGTVMGTREVFTREINQSYMATNPSSGTIMTSGANDDVVATIAHIPEVSVVEGRHITSLRFKLQSTDQWKQIQIKSMVDYKNAKLNRIIPLQGAWPPPDKQILLERTALSWMGAAIGDTITVELNNGKTRQIKIGGTIHDQSGPPTSLSGVPLGYVSQNTLSWLNESTDFSEISFLVAENRQDKAHATAVGEIIRRKVENSGLLVPFVRIENPGEHPINNVIQPLLTVLTALGWLSLALSSFLVVNTISALLTQQTRQIGIMKAIGARRSQIIVLYFVTVIFYGVLALLIAMPLGLLGSWGLTGFLAQFFNTNISSYALPSWLIVLQIAVGLLIPLMASFYPILAGTRITVREAISGYNTSSNFGQSLIDHVIQRLRGISRPLMLSLRNTFRRKTRLALTLITLTLAGTIFITVFSVRDSSLATLNNTLNYWNYDIDVRFDQPYRLQKISKIVDQITGITTSESWGYKTVNRLRSDNNESDNLTLIALKAETQMIKPTLLSGRWLQPEDTNALVVNSDFLEDESDLQLGQMVTLKENNRQSDWKIVGVVQGTFAGSVIYANYAYATDVFRDVGKATSVQISTTSQETADQVAIAQQLEQQFKLAGFQVNRIVTISSLQANVENTFNFLVSFLLIMAVVLAIVGGLGLSGTMSINVLERVREIGVMRAIGATDRAILQLVLVEGMLIGGISWTIGTIMALPLSKITSDLVGEQLFNSPLSFTFSITGTLIWFALAVGLAAVASFLPARNASRMTVREVLAYE